MLKEQAKLFRTIAIFADICGVAAAFFFAYLLMHRVGVRLNSLREYLWVLLILAPVWFVLLEGQGLYDSIRRLSLFDLLTKVFNVHLLGGGIVAAIIFLVEKDRYSRQLFATIIICSFLLIALEKILLRAGLGLLRQRGLNSRNLLIVGTQEKAREFQGLVDEHADWGLKITGFVQVIPGDILTEVGGRPVLGRLDQLIDLCKNRQIDEVVFCLPRPREIIIDVEDYLRDLEELGITVRMVLGDFSRSTHRRELVMFHERMPILTFHVKTFDGQQLLYKRLLDILGAVVGLVINVLVFPFIAAAIKWEAPGPIFFSQNRVGENGRLFKCWKYRSMYVDAEERKKDLLAQNEMNGAVFKMKNDPRVTTVGAFLRKTSLDELPQFWNVLRGEMSLVGTRPPTPDEVSMYENWQRRRISIKPGITGLWQVSGRNQISDFDEIVRLDLQYIDKWDIWVDIKILLKTVKVVVFREGSC